MNLTQPLQPKLITASSHPKLSLHRTQITHTNALLYSSMPPPVATHPRTFISSNKAPQNLLIGELIDGQCFVYITKLKIANFC